MKNHKIANENTSPMVSKKSLLIKTFFVTFIAVLICYLVYMQILQSKTKVLQDNQNDKLTLISTEFAKEVSSIKKLTQVLANNNNLKRGAIPRFKYRDPQSLKRINNYFVNFGLMSPTISQIRWLDIVGNERFRVNFKEGQAHVVKPENLQNKMSRYYFRQGIAVDSPDSFLSPIDLNVEYGKVTTPLEPTIRVTHRTNKNDHIVDGLIVVNFNLTEFFKKIKDISSKDNQINIINSDGFWLFNNDASKEWGFMLKKPHHNLKNMNPTLWQILTSQNEHTLRYMDEDMYTIGKLPTLYSKKHKDALNETIYIYIKSGEKIIANLALSSFLYALLCAFIFFVVSIFFLYREYRYDKTIHNLVGALKTEKTELKDVNTTLSHTIKQQQLLQKNLIEAQKLSSLGMLVAGVAHEMNTPIGGAIISVSNADSVIKRLSAAIKIGLTKSQLENDTASIKDNLELATLNLDKAAVIVKSFKKMAIDRNNEDIVESNIKDIIGDLLIAFNSRLKNSKVKVNTQFNGSMNLKSRPGIISQVVENLLMNALTHAFEKNQPGEIEIKALNVGEGIKIIV